MGWIGPFMKSHNIVHVQEEIKEDLEQKNKEENIEKKVNLSSRRESSHVGKCYSLYTRVLFRIISIVDSFFLAHATNVAKHPVIWIAVTTLLVSLCSLGVLRYHIESKSNVLFIPAESEAAEALDESKEFFANLRNTRHEAILLKPKYGDNVMTPPCIQEGKQIVQSIVSLKNYQHLCIPKPKYAALFAQHDSTQNCSLINPLELIKNGSQPLVDVTDALYGLTLMSNGKLPKHNEPAMLGQVERSGNNFTKIGILRVAFNMKETNNNDILKWEEEYIERMRTLKPSLKCVSLFYFAARSVDDSIAESVAGDIFLTGAAFGVMVTFAIITMAKFNNPIRGHFLLAIFGVLSTSLGIVGGLGLAMAIGTPIVSIVGILPFLVLSIGIDDMFIIVDEFDRRREEEDVVNRVSQTMRHVGATITMTTITDIIAFAIGISSAFPGIKHFSVFATFAFIVEFFFQITFFVAILTLDGRRIKAKRLDCVPFCRGKDKNLIEFTTTSKITDKLASTYATTLLKWPAKLVVMLISCGLLGAGAYGCVHVSQEFHLADIATDGSYFKEYSTVFQMDFTQAIGVNVFKAGSADYSDSRIQTDLEQVPIAAVSTGYYSLLFSSWFHDYKAWANVTPGVNIEGKNFTLSLRQFFRDPRNTHFQSNVHLSSSNEIMASQIQVFTKPTSKTTVMREAMLTFRKELKDRGIEFKPMADEFLYIEQYASVVGEVTRNIFAAAGAVVLVTLPFCVNPIIVLLLLFTFLLLITELIGLMYFWGVSINAISMIFLMMSIGFAVDYSAHVAHAFVTSNEKTVNARIVHALTSIGGSVLKGGISTFLGMLITAFAASEIFRIFFRMFFGIIVFGLFNGLALLPVLLSLCAPLLATKDS